jgi:phosphoribosylformylglycinamidine cyclo-ligase
MCFSIDRASWPVPNIFQKIQKRGKIENSEMFRTFNMGIGMVLVVSKESAVRVRSFLHTQRVESYIIGDVIEHKSSKVVFKS